MKSPRHIVLLLLLAHTLPATAQERIVVSDPFPEGVIARFGVPQPHGYAHAIDGGCTKEGALIVAAAFENVIHISAWQSPRLKSPAHRLDGHVGKIARLDLSENGQVLATVDSAHSLRIWSVLTGKILLEKRLAGDAVTMLTLDATGDRLAVGTAKSLTLWDVKTGKQRDYRGPVGHVTAAAFSPDGNLLAIGDQQGRVQIWETDTATYREELPWKPMPDVPNPSPVPVLKLGGFGAGQFPGADLRHTIDFYDGVYHLQFSPDSKRLAAAGGTVVRHWQLEEQTLLWEHNHHSFILYDWIPRGSAPNPPHQAGQVRQLTFANDGQTVLSLGYGGILRTTAGNGKSETIQFEPGSAFGRFVLTSDGKSLLHYSGSQNFQEFDFPSGKMIADAGGGRRPENGLAFSPDGKRLAAFGGTMQLWDVKTQTLLSSAPATFGSGQGTAFSPNGNYVKSGAHYTENFTIWKITKDLQIQLWDEQKSFVNHAEVGFFLPDQPASVFIASSNNGNILNLADKTEKRFPSHFPIDPIGGCPAPDGKTLVVEFSYNRLPTIYDRQNMKPLRPLAGWTAAHKLIYSPDGRLIAGCANDNRTKGAVHLWDAATGKRYLDLTKGHTETVHTVAFSSDGRLLASTGADMRLCLWETATGKLIRTIPADSRSGRALAFHPHQPWLASSGTDNAIYLWDVAKDLRTAPPLPKDLGRDVAPGTSTGMWSQRIPLPAPPGGIAFSPGGKTLAVSAGPIIHLFDPLTGKESKQMGKHENPIVFLKYSPDGRMLASASELFEQCQPVRVWHVATGLQQFGQTARRTMAPAVAFSADGKTLYHLTDLANRTSYSTRVQGWQWQAKPPNRSIEIDLDTRTYAFAVSPDGKHLLSSGKPNDLVLYDIATQRTLVRRPLSPDNTQQTLRIVAFSPDGKLAACVADHGENRVLQLLDAATLKTRHTIPLGPVHHSTTVAFSPRGDLLAAGCRKERDASDRVGIWDTQTGELLMRLHGTGRQISWSPNGRWLATAADVTLDRDDHAVVLWDVDLLRSDRE